MEMDVVGMVLADSSRTIPYLENGDRLHQAEFERRYAASPDVKKAELIEGVVYVASPLRFIPHAEPHSHLVLWLGTYKANHPNLRIGIEATLRLDNDNEPQPDIVMFRADSGRTSISEEGYLVGAPELVVEISASTTSYDLHGKKKAYERNEVKEYIVWRTFDQAIDWFVWENGQYQRLVADNQGVLCSQEFTGLRLDVPALLRGDMGTVLATLHGLPDEK
jgi:Uma2 family endonuclease